MALYYAIGGYISAQSRAARWGSNAIGTISELLQQELPGLRGFSETSIKRMRIFYEAWCGMFENRPLSADDLQNSIIPVGDKGHIEIRPLTTDELPPETLEAFLAVGFTNHYEILAQKKDVEQRLFYIVNCATGFWNGDKLKFPNPPNCLYLKCHKMLILRVLKFFRVLKTYSFIPCFAVKP